MGLEEVPGVGEEGGHDGDIDEQADDVEAGDDGFLGVGVGVGELGL